MKYYGYTIGASRRPRRLWVVPYVVTFEEIVEHVVSGGLRINQ